MPFSRTEPNVPDYEEDPNSPFSAFGPLPLANSYERLIIQPTIGGTFDTEEIQVNEDLGLNYDMVDTSDSSTNNRNAFEVPPSPFEIRLTGRPNKVTYYVVPDTATTGLNYRGENTDISGPITEVLSLTSQFRGATMEARAFGIVE